VAESRTSFLHESLFASAVDVPLESADGSARVESENFLVNGDGVAAAFG